MSVTQALAKVCRARIEFDSANSEGHDVREEYRGVAEKVIEMLERANIRSGSFRAPDGSLKRVRVLERKYYRSLTEDILDELFADPELELKFDRVLNKTIEERKEKTQVAPRKRARKIQLAKEDGDDNFDDGDPCSAVEDRAKRRKGNGSVFSDSTNLFGAALFQLVLEELRARTSQVSKKLNVDNVKARSRVPCVEITDASLLDQVRKAWDRSTRIEEVNAKTAAERDKFRDVCLSHSDSLHVYLEQRGTNTRQVGVTFEKQDHKFTVGHGRTSFTVSKFVAPLDRVISEFSVKESHVDADPHLWLAQNREALKKRMNEALHEAREDLKDKDAERVYFRPASEKKPHSKK